MLIANQHVAHCWVSRMLSGRARLGNMLHSVDGLMLEPLCISGGGSPDARLLARSFSARAGTGHIQHDAELEPEPEGCAAPNRSQLKVHLFPTFATRAEGSDFWTAHIHGWIFDPAPEVATNPEARWYAHRISRNLACRALGLKELGMEGDVEGEGPRRIFRRRRKWLFRRTVAGRRVTLRVGNTEVNVDCDPMGHFKATQQLTHDEICATLGEGDLAAGSGCEPNIAPASSPCLARASPLLLLGALV